MEEKLKNEIMNWLYQCKNYEEIENKNITELEKRIKEKTIKELAHKLLTHRKKTWDLEFNEILVLRTYFGVHNKCEKLTIIKTAIQLDYTWQEMNRKLEKIKKHINREFAKRRLDAMLPEDIKNLSIYDLNLPDATIDKLKRNGIDSVGELTNLTINNLKVMESIGKKTIENIIEQIHKYGLSFKEEMKEEQEKIIEPEKPEEKLRREYDKKLSERYNLDQEINFSSNRRNEINLLLELRKMIDEEIEEYSKELEKYNRKKIKTKKI